MSSLFSKPQQPAPVPVVNAADTQNRVRNALGEKLAQGGSNSTLTTPFGMGAPTGAGKAPTLTGLS